MLFGMLDNDGRTTPSNAKSLHRSGIAITASYAMRQSSRLLKVSVLLECRKKPGADQFSFLGQNVKSEDREELISLQQRLESKIQVIAPAIDMIELM